MFSSLLVVIKSEIHEVFTTVTNNFKINIFCCRVVCKVCNHLLFHKGIQILLVVLSPTSRWQLSNLKARSGVSPNTFCDPSTIFFENLTLETSEPRCHFFERHTTQSSSNVFLDVLGIEWWDIATETCTNTLCSIHKYHWKSWHIEVWFNGATIIIKIVENWVVPGIKDLASLLGQFCEDVPRLRSIFATHETSTELTTWLKEVDVV